MATKKSLSLKLKQVNKEGKGKNEKKANENVEMKKLVKKLATDMSSEVVYNTVRKAVASTEFTMNLVNVAARTAVKSAELLKKYPPLPDNLQKLSEPRTATYIALYNRHRNILKPKAIGTVKMKIAEYLQKIEEISLQERLDKAARKERRMRRKTEAIAMQKEKEFENFCNEKCDEIFSLVLNQFTKTFNVEREIPKPLILGPSSVKLYQSIQGQITKLISQRKAAEATQALESVEHTVKNSMGTGVTPKLLGTGGSPQQKSDTEKSTDKVDPRKTPVKMKVAATDTATAAENLVTDPDDAIHTKEDSETKEIIDRLSYFIMEFVENSLMEAV